MKTRDVIKMLRNPGIDEKQIKYILTYHNEKIIWLENQTRELTRMFDQLMNVVDSNIKVMGSLSKWSEHVGQKFGIDPKTINDIRSEEAVDKKVHIPGSE